jgi:predicted DsbA family dithiol-disulfide isomerase
VDVEIWSDVACPWCYIGKRRFEAALSRFEHADQVQVTWRSFELDPSAPLEREGNGAVRLAEKYGISVERARRMREQVAQNAAGEGLAFQLDLQRQGSTFDAHRMIHLAAEHGLQDAMKERLMRAYFSEGELVGDPETLLRLAAEVGIPDDDARETVAGERFAAEVREDERTAAAFGISAVPTFVVDRAIAASGAHPAEQLLSLLRQGWANRSPLAVVADGERCSVDGC